MIDDPGPTPSTAPPADADIGPRPRRRRPRVRVILIGAGTVAVVAALLFYLRGRGFESTDDAQIDADISSIGARVAGTITQVHVVENQPVVAGQVLADIDPTDLQVALTQAAAAVAQAEAQLEAEHPTVLITRASNTAALTNASSDTVSAAAAVIASQRDVEQLAARVIEASANHRNAELDRQRAQQLIQADAIPRAELDRRESAATATAASVEATRQALSAGRERVAQQKAQLLAVKGRLVEVRATAPNEVRSREASVKVRQANLALALAQQHQAELNVGYARIRTPVPGIVARKAVNTGDYVARGQTLAAVTRTTDVWVTANFRETQIERMRPGQTASIHVDALDRGFSGVVESLGGATGSRLSVLPPENASGNYVKVVQRLPVRIRLDGGQAGLDRLRPGMSVTPKVRVQP